MKLLLISYYFPPYNSVGGVRPGKLAKYLYNQGHEIDVISAEQPFPVEAELEIPPERVSFLTRLVSKCACRIIIREARENGS